jgi:hypothetical protein
MTSTVTQPAPQVERDRYQRPLIIPPGGGKKIPYRRVTTYIDVLSDRYLLELSKQRKVAHGLAMRPDLVLKAASAAGDKKLLNEVAKAASEAAGASQAATVGTALHAITEQIDRGEDALIPPSAQADIDAYRKATAHLKIKMIEVFVVHDDLKVGGTFDRVVELDGTNYVADIKTGSIDWDPGKIEMQLAMYARGQVYDPRTGERTPLDVDTTRGLVIHLPAGSGQCTLPWADLTIGWAGVQIAKDVWDWRGLSGHLQAEPPGLDLFAVIAGAPDRPCLESLYQEHSAVWTDIHTAAAKRRLLNLESSSPAPAA